MKRIFSIICLCLMCAFASAQVVETGSMKDNWYISGNVGTTIGITIEVGQNQMMY